MKSMTADEIDRSLESLQSCLGYEMTNVLFDEKVLQISLSSEDTYLWVTFSLKPQTYFFVGDSKTRTIKGLKKPLTTFSQTHLKGRSLCCCERLESEGRVIQLSFSEDKSYFLKVMLFPGGQNVIVQAGDKKLAAFKPRELNSNQLEPDFSRELVRSTEEFQNYWLNLKPKKSALVSEDSSELKKALKKKKRGLVKMEESLKQLQENTWGEVGEWLKTQSALSQVPEPWKTFVDETQSLAWNIENSFSQMKKSKNKIQGTLERMEILKAEIINLEKGKWDRPLTQKKSLMHLSEAKGRTRKLSDGSSFYVGKSGKDNLALLRKAKPWFLWMHIRDYPGAHGILERPKKAGETSLKILQEAAVEVLKQTVKGVPEGPYEILIAECRYVRPIKGGKPGQVTHSHEKVLKITL